MAKRCPVKRKIKGTQYELAEVFHPKYSSPAVSQLRAVDFAYKMREAGKTVAVLEGPQLSSCVYIRIKKGK